MHVLRSVFTWLAMLLFTGLMALVLVPLLVVSLGRLRAPLIAVMQPLWGRTAAALAGIELRIEGQEHLVGRRPRVCVANHASTFDLVGWAAANVPDPLPIVKQELRWVPPMNLVFWLMGAVFLDRKGGRGIADLQRAAEIIQRDGRSVQMSPEGTRSADGKLLPFKKGPFHLAWQARADIVPLVIHGTHAIRPKGSWWVRPGVLRVEIKAPVRPTGDAAADAAALHRAYADWMG